jgi:type II secretory pathway pseudopilin PulG
MVFTNRRHAGYAMASLLVALGVMSVLMSAALPVWRRQAQREKEAELIFRGEQYARAIALYQRKMGPGTYPPSIDVLVQQRFLRKKFRDPMVEDGEFQVIPPGGIQSSAPGISQQGPGGARGGSTPAGRGSPTPQPQSPSGGFVAGGVMGVVSKSKEASLRIYKGGTHYNEWQFIAVNQSLAPGGGPGRGRPGGPGMGTPVPGAPGRGGRGPGGRGPGTDQGPGRGFGPGGNPGGGFPVPGRRGGGTF